MLRLLPDRACLGYWLITDALLIVELSPLVSTLALLLELFGGR